MPDRDDLRDRPTGVVGHEQHVLHVEAVEELRDERGDPVRGEVRGVVQRLGVRPEREVGREAPVSVLQPLDDTAPQGAVGEQAVQEDNGRRVTAFAEREGSG